MSAHRLAAAAVLLAAACASQASIVNVTNQANFLAATGAVVDKFADLTINSDLGTNSIDRLGGRYGYTAHTETDFFVVPVAGTVALSTAMFNDTITFDNFADNVFALGGNFFATNDLGEVTGGALTVLATDINGLTSTIALPGGSAAGFAGFLSDVRLASVQVSMTKPNTNAWVTVDNVAMRVPVPQTLSLVLAALALLPLASRQRRG